MTAVADIPLDTILAKLRAIAPAIKARRRYASLLVFGSRARGDARPDSDLDLLVDAGSLRDNSAAKELLDCRFVSARMQPG